MNDMFWTFEVSHSDKSPLKLEWANMLSMVVTFDVSHPEMSPLNLLFAKSSRMSVIPLTSRLFRSALKGDDAMMLLSSSLLLTCCLVPLDSNILMIMPYILVFVLCK